MNNGSKAKNHIRNHYSSGNGNREVDIVPSKAVSNVGVRSALSSKFAH